MKTLLITGTDTDAGKTVLTSCLAAYWQTYYPSLSWGIMKPIQSGKGDRELYGELFSLSESPEEITPIYLQTPVAPPIAARREGKPIELGKLWQTFNRLQQQKDWLLVEALGGLGSPVTEELIVADIARDWRLPVALVVPVKLGAIGQAVANIALARQYEVEIEGIILNCINPCSSEQLADWAPIDLIESLTYTQVLGILPHLADPKDLTKLAQVASNLDLERLLMANG